MLNDLVEMENPLRVFEEVKTIVLKIFSEFDFEPLDHLFHDTLRLFKGEYPGFRSCDTEYHNLKHTTDTFLAMARIIHGAILKGHHFSKRGVRLGLASALLHDSGYILANDETGPGALYTLVHIDRSIDFLKKYCRKKGYSREEMAKCDAILRCTGLNVRIDEIRFLNREHEMLGKMLGAADLLGQMADRTYLEKLPFLYLEFKEAGIEGLGTELEFLDDTVNFYHMTRKRFAQELDGVDIYMRDHFRERWDIDENLYLTAIENHIQYLKHILKHHRDDVHAYLRRGGFMERLPKQRFA